MAEVDYFSDLRIDSQAAPGTAAGTIPPPAAPEEVDYFADLRLKDESVAFGSIGRGLNRMQQAGNILLSEIGIISPASAAKAIARDEADIAQYPVSPTYRAGMEEIGAAAEKGWGPMALAMLKNPSTLLSVVGESIPASGTMLAGAGVGALGGPAGMVGGAGLSSFATEYASSIMDVLQENKVDTGDANAIEKALQNPDLMHTARERAVKRGVPIAMFDAISFGMAGRIAHVMGATVEGATKARKIAAGAVETAAQAGYGGAGEAAGEVVAGQEIDPRAIGLEAAAEVVTGAPEIAIGVTREQAAAVPPPEPEPAGAIIPAEIVPDTSERMVVNEPEMTLQTGEVLPAGDLHGQTVRVVERNENMSLVETEDGARRRIGNDLLEPVPQAAPAAPVTPEQVAVETSIDEQFAREMEVPDSPRLTESDRKSPIPNEIIDTGKAAVEAATGQPSTFTTTAEVNGKREVVTGKVSDLVSQNRAETAAVTAQIMEGVSTPEILAGTQPTAPPVSAAGMPATAVPTGVPATPRPSLEAQPAIEGTPLAAKGDTLSDQIKKLKARSAAYDAEIAELASSGTSVKMVSNRDPNRRVMIGPDMSEPGMFRVTYFDEQGPSGHTIHNTMEQAARDVIGSYHPVGNIARQVVKRDVAVTPGGREVPVVYAVVEADDLVTSQRDEGGANPAYPQELQPRDRARGTSDIQINEIAQNLDPRLLDNNVSASDGAPIISADGVVESGNGRVLAIRRAYRQNLPTAQGYRNYLGDQGYIDLVGGQGMRNPVLVRIRQGQLEQGERTAFTREANERTTMALSATERAMADAAAMSPETVGLFRGGEIAEAGNRDFVRSFMASVVSPNEQGAMVTPDGELSQEAIRRVQAALLARAFGDPDLVGALVESTDNNIKAIGNALMDVAGLWSQMRAEAADGSINPGAEITPNLLEAVRLVQRARNEGKALAGLVGQKDIFTGSTVPPETEAVLRLMFRNTASWTMPAGREKLAEALRFYATEARKTSAGVDLLGEKAPAASRILEEAKKRQYGEEEKQAKLPGGDRTARPDTGAPSRGRAVEAQPRAQAARRPSPAPEAPAAEVVARVKLPSGQTLTVEHPDEETYRAVIDGKRVGLMNLTLKRAAPYATSITVEGPRRLGIATALYDAAEKVLGRRLIPSPLGLSESAIAFWKNRLAKMDPAEKQALLAESLAIGQEAKVGKSARQRVDQLGYQEPLPTAKFAVTAPGPVATPEQRESFYRPPAKTLDQVYEEAPALQAALVEIGEAIAADVEGVRFKQPPGPDNGIKKRDIAEEKFGRKTYQSASEMTDIIRSGFVVQNPSQANAIIKRLTEFFEVLDEGWFRTEEEYFDRKALIKFPNGQVGEVQFWEPNMFDAKMTKRFGPRSGENLYTEWRDIFPKTSPKALALSRQMFELYSLARGFMEPFWSNIGSLSKADPKYLKRRRQEASSQRPPVWRTSAKSTLTQPVSGRRTETASVSPSKVGRPSQETNLTTGKTSPINVVQVAAKGKGKQEYPLAPPDDWYSDLDYKARGGVMTTMTPDEFLNQVRPLTIDESSRDNIDDMKRHIQRGRTLDPLKIYSDGKEDGRHRAVAAKELGITEVPVIVFPQKPRPKFKAGPAAPAPQGAAETLRVQGGEISLAISPSFAKKKASVLADLRKRLDGYGLTGIDLKGWEMMFADMESGASGLGGMYLRKVIHLALQFGDPDAVLDHEVVHGLFDVALTDSEKAILLRKSAKEWISDEIKANYPGASRRVLAEEGVAHAFPLWQQGQKMDGMINRIFKKLQTFLKAVYQSLTGHDIRTADDVFRQMASGKVGRRTAAAPASRQPSFAVTETVDMFEGPREQFVLPGAEKLTDAQLAQRRAQEKLQAKKPQKSVEALPLFGDQKDQLALFSKPPSGPNDPRFLLTRPPNGAQQAQQVTQGFLNRGQPVDRAIRVTFQLLGGLDNQNRWRPSKRLSDKYMGPQQWQAAGIGGLVGGALGGIAGGPIGAGAGFVAGGTVGRFILGSAAAPTNGKFGWLKGIGENAKRGLIDGYGLDPKYIEAYHRSDLGKTAILRQAAGIMKVLSNAGVGTREAEVLQQILSGKAVNDEAMRRLAVPIRQAIDDLGAEAVSLGLISAESFERNRGAYLHRVYAKNEIDQGTLAGWVSTRMTSRRKKIIGDQLKGRGMFWDVDSTRLMRDVESFKAGRRGAVVQGEKFHVIDEVSSVADLMGGAPKEKTLRRVYLPTDEAVPAKYQGATWVDRGQWEARKTGKTTTLWRDYTEAERAKMGEIVDARYTIAKTFMLMANDLATGRFYKEVSEKEEWTRSTPPPDEASWKAGGEYGVMGGRYWDDPNIRWVKVPDTTIEKTGGKKRWGALSGKFVRAEIWRDLNEINIANNPGVWRKLFTQWKRNKTARNPVVHMNNIVSNLMFMDLADVRAQDLVKGMKAYATSSADYIEARDNGAFGSDVVSQELRQNILQPILEEINKQQLGTTASLLAPSSRFMSRAKLLGVFADKLWTTVKTIDNGMLRAYQVEDEIFRMATYMRRRSQGESPRVAAQNARDQFLNYDIRAPWVVAARNSVLPFISYTYRAVPKLMESIAHRPWKVAKYAAIAYAVNALSYMLDEGDDGEDRERAALRDEEQGYSWLGNPRMIRMPWRDKNGLPVFLDVRRWIPAGDIFDTTQGSSAIPVPGPLHFGGPLQLAWELMLNKQAFTGDEITDDLTMNNAEKFTAVADYAWKAWTPAAFWMPNSWYWTKIGNAIHGATDTAGHPYSVPQAVLSSFGIKVKPVDIQDGIKWHYFDFRKVQNALKADFRSLSHRLERGLISQEAFDSGAAKIMEKYENLGQRVGGFNKRIEKPEKVGG